MQIMCSSKAINTTAINALLINIYPLYIPMCIHLYIRNPAKESVARRCFEIWCKKMRTHSPFPSLSHPDDYISQLQSQDSNTSFSPKEY